MFHQRNLEITIVVSFLKIFLEFSKKKENTLILKILKISLKSQRQAYSKLGKVSFMPFSSKDYVIESYNNHFKDLEPMPNLISYSWLDKSGKEDQNIVKFLYLMHLMHNSIMKTLGYIPLFLL